MTDRAVFEETPFGVLQRSVELLTSGPDQPVLCTWGIADVGPTLPAQRVAAILGSPTSTVVDAVWRRVIARVRTGQASWTVIACGVMVPRLRTSAVRYCRVPSSHRGDAESEMLTALLDALHTANISGPDVGSRLWYAAFKAATRYCYHARRDHRSLCANGGIDEGRVAHAVLPSSPRDVLANAVTCGVLSPVEAQLVGRTRLEAEPLTQVAADLGLVYVTARRWRRAAESRLANEINEEISSSDERDRRVTFFL